MSRKFSRMSEASFSFEGEATLGPSESFSDIKARSANIQADPKMAELKHYTRSHQHEQRLRESAELEQRLPSASGNRRALRAEGCGMMDSQMKQLSKGEAIVPYIMKSSELPESFREKSSAQADLKDSLEQRMAMLRRMDRFQTRLQWRDSMDHSLKRLLIDLDLSNNERLKEYAVKHAVKMGEVPPDETEDEREAKAAAEVKKMRFARARCQHLDKIYSWYQVHGRKEARKERKAPPYLLYDPQHPVMPGSMRVAPLMLNKTSQPSHGMGHSSSSPALLAAGAAATAASLPTTAAAPPEASSPAAASPSAGA